MSPRIRTFDGVIALMLDNGVIIQGWGPRAPIERFNWWLAQLEEAIRATPSGITVLSVTVMRGGSSQDSEIRARAKTELLRLAPSFKRYVIYPLDETAFAALARTVLRTMLMMSAKTRQFSLAGSEQEALAAIYDPAGPSREELEQALKHVVAAVEQFAHGTRPSAPWSP